jgi:NAD(P)-dependent dehydrogenase (short-subunit alcohol dehydrogenase family)
MAAAFAPNGIRVNALAPGPVDTQMMRNNPPEFIEATANQTCYGD